MRNWQILIAIVIVGTVAAAGVVLFIGDDDTQPLKVASVIDGSDLSSDLAFVGPDGDIPLAEDTVIPEKAEIRYSGNCLEWSDAIVVDEEKGTVMFPSGDDYDGLELIMEFDGIDNSSLKGTLKDGMPCITFDPVSDIKVSIRMDDTIEDQVKECVFTTYEYTMQGDTQLPTYYDDTFLIGRSTELNRELMTFALCLELSTGLEHVEGKDRSASVVKLLNDIGCTKVGINDAYTKEPTIRSTDAAIGYKEWGGYNVIFLALNGTHYKSEFAANVILGKSGSHEGFTYARDAGLELLRDFIEENEITGRTKILVTGYSRTAAGANLLAAYISDAVAEGTVKERIGNIELMQRDVYGFSFETPLCGHFGDKGEISPTDHRYDNIWYVTNPDDPVTYVPTEHYGFVRYGQRYVIESHDIEKQQIMLKNAVKYYGDATSEILDMSKFTKISDISFMSDLNEGFFNKFFEKLGTREYYCENIEVDFSRTIYAFCYKEEFPTDIMEEAGGTLSLILELYLNAGDYDEFKAYLSPIVTKAAEKNGMEEYSDNVVDAAYQIAQLIKRYADGKAMSIITDKYILSMVANYKVLIVSHMPSMVYCYLIQGIPYYDGEWMTEEVATV